MNKLLDNVRAALSSLASNKLRALLTTIGIGIGISAVIVLVSLGNSVQDYLNRQLLSVGTDLIAITPQVTFAGPAVDRGSRLATNSLTQRDLTLLSDPFSLPNVKAIVPIVLATRVAAYAENTESVQIYGTTASYFDTLNRSLASGELFTDDDVASTARVAVLGQTVIQNLFPVDASVIGSTIRIGDVSFRVIGTLQKSGGGGGGGQDQDDLIVIPLSTAQTFLETTRDVSGQYPLQAIYLKAQLPDAVDEIAATATAILHQSHRIKPGKDNDFMVTTEKDFLNTLNAVLGVLTIFLAFIGGISLLVGGIGVMNIMLVSVTERTREIGLRKAVGARGQDVLLQFLTEAVVLCFVGGLAGFAVALLATTAIGLAVPDLKAAVSPTAIVLAISVTTLIGVFFGIYPASRAAALHPIAALRRE